MVEVAGPNLGDLADALARLRSHMGQNVVFYFAEVLTWPEGTQLDPESGRPYDSQVEPESKEEPESITIKCNVAFRPTEGLSEDTAESPIGNIQQNEVLLIMSVPEMETVAKAVSFDVKGDNFKVKKSTPDGIGSEYRGLVWGERQGEAA